MKEKLDVGKNIREAKERRDRGEGFWQKEDSKTKVFDDSLKDAFDKCNERHKERSEIN